MTMDFLKTMVFMKAVTMMNKKSVTRMSITTRIQQNGLAWTYVKMQTDTEKVAQNKARTCQYFPT